MIRLVLVDYVRDRKGYIAKKEAKEQSREEPFPSFPLKQDEEGDSQGDDRCGKAEYNLYLKIDLCVMV